jgi:hypothetical protein
MGPCWSTKQTMSPVSKMVALDKTPSCPAQSHLMKTCSMLAISMRAILIQLDRHECLMDDAPTRPCEQLKLSQPHPMIVSNQCLDGSPPGKRRPTERPPPRGRPVRSTNTGKMSHPRLAPAGGQATTRASVGIINGQSSQATARTSFAPLFVVSY